MQLLVGLLIGAILFFLVLPTLLVIPISLNDSSYIELPPKGLTLRWYAEFLSDPDWRAATMFSLQIALATTVASTVVGTLAAIGLVRGNLPGKTFLQALSLGPMIVPHVVFGVALYLVFSPLSLTGNFTGFLIAHTVLAVPYVIITVSAALERFDTSLELAALNCGASRSRAFFSIVLPNIAPAVAAASVFAFLASFDEATVAFFISDTGGKTISRKMFEDIDFNLTPVIAAVSTLLVAVSLALMATVHLLTGRGED
ncbi:MULTISPECIES: ABC transporter permease [Rhizobium]|uniref:ABC transporter permease n=1 Tax=Rhizobium TaxID=379 RepID=UPI000BE936E6|nr:MULTISPECIES: ABC transporter permease [Rhizobium]NKM53360.1 ABC transporter permease subunit [Rhizobium anhuiense]PDS63699.1 ABC transporter permease [Rhizobium anhuiense]